MTRILRALALAMTLIIAVPASGLGQMLFYCTMTGEVSSHCCCHRGDRLTDSPVAQKAARRTVKVAHTISRRSSCCEALKNNDQFTNALAEVFNLQQSAAAVAILPKTYLPFPDAVSDIPSRDVIPVGYRGPPPATITPIYKRNCSYLN